MHAPVTAEIAGAKQTQCAGGFLTPIGLEEAGQLAFAKLGAPWPAFHDRAVQNAVGDLKSATTEYQRNRRRVIEYAVVRSPEGLAASAVLAPNFLEHFQETLGPTVLLVVPNRYVAFVFPKLAGSYEEYASVILEAYRATAWPVSLEVFELGPGGLKTIGAFSDPAQN